MQEIEHDIMNFWTFSIINLKTIKKSLVILIKFETDDNAGSLHEHKKVKDKIGDAEMKRNSINETLHSHLEIFKSTMVFHLNFTFYSIMFI